MITPTVRLTEGPPYFGDTLFHSFFTLCTVLCLATLPVYAEPQGDDTSLLRKAAEQGDAKAQYNLGLRYASGKALPQDNVMAYMWMNIAGATGDEEAARERNLLERLMSREEIAEAQRRCSEWVLQKAQAEKKQQNQFPAAEPIMTQVEMNALSNKKFERTDAELNQVYQKALKDLGSNPENNSEGAAALKESQRAWLILRDKTSEAFASKSGGGTIQNMLYMQCQESMSARRIRELKHLFLIEDNFDPSYEE